MPFFDIFASPRWSPLRMRTKVASFFIFFQDLSNKKKIKALRPKMTKIASRGGGPALTGSSQQPASKAVFFFELIGSDPCLRPASMFAFTSPPHGPEALYSSGSCGTRRDETCKGRQTPSKKGATFLKLCSTATPPPSSKKKKRNSCMELKGARKSCHLNLNQFIKMGISVSVSSITTKY